MKVVVCFGAVRVLVPVGAGELPVRELVREATRRYNKATGQGPERWVGVRALRGSSGGILDPDDRVCDVADDRETLAAECAGPLLRPSRTPPPARARGGDGASGSSAGTASPDMFRGGGGVEVGGSERCVEVGASELEEGGGGLQVRRGSEPSLHQDTLPSGPQMSGQTKRWSAAVVCREEARLTQRARPPPEPPVHPGAAASPAHHQPFQRHHNRLSMQFSGPGSGGGAWLDAADRALPPPATLGTKSLPRDTRKEPLGRDTAAERDHRAEEVVRWVSGVQIAAGAEGGRQQLRVSLVKGERGLGFTITTRDNPTAGHPPIYIKNILPKGAAVADGRLRAGDRLVSVNSLSVAGLAQAQVVTLLRNTPTHSTVHLLVERAHTPQRSECAVQEDSGGVRWTEKAVGSPEERTVAEERGGGGGGGGGGRSDRLVLRLEVPVHDSEKAGLGISVKGKVTVGPAPHDLGIFIKSVLHGGAASRDGRLHTNDQLLCVNGVSLAGQSNARAMDTLRRALLHSRPPPSPAASPAARVISLTVARRTESTESLERWKDDTPPSGHESSSNTTHDHNTTVVYNDNNSGSTPGSPSPADIRNNNHNKPPYASVIHITNNNNSSWTSNQSDDSKGGGGREEVDKKRDSFEWSRLEGWNPVIDRLTGLRNESYYIATQAQHPQLPRHRQHVILEEDAYSRVAGAGGVCESGSESAGETAFTRDAIGRRSMSEKRHATVDAKTTGTYRKIKELKAINAEAGAVGPALGMRKSSSLESLQTAVQEQQRQRTGEPLYAPHAQRTRRAPLHPPLKHWLTDEGCAGAGEGVGVTRGSPQQSSLSHKKPSVLRSLASMLRLSRPARRAEEAYVRTQPGRASDKTMSHEPAPDPGPQVPPDRRPHYTYRGGGEREPGEPLYGAPPHRAAPPAGAWPPAGHYANYQQIQHNLSARREKLSEVQIGQMRRQVAVQRARALDDDTRRAGAGGGFHSQRSCREGGGGGAGARPQSNYYEYESIQRHQQQQQHRGHR